MTEQDILNIIEKDEKMMKIIRIASSLDLPDWVIGAGFVRNKIWNYLSEKEQKSIDASDIDLVYFDPNGNDEKSDEKLSEEMRNKTGIEWEIVNEYHANKWNNLPPYTSTEDAISQWPETVTAIGITLDKKDKLKLIAPYGINDLVNFIVRPSPKFKDIERVKERIEKKRWIEKWPKITLCLDKKIC